MKKKTENVLTLTAGRGSAEEKLKSVASEKVLYVLYCPDRERENKRGVQVSELLEIERNKQTAEVVTLRIERGGVEKLKSARRT